MDTATTFRRQIREVVEATHLTDDGYMSWFGATTHIDCPADELGRCFRQELATILYRDFYTRGRATLSPPEHRLSPADLARRNMIGRYAEVVTDQFRIVAGQSVTHSTQTHIQVDLSGLLVEVPIERTAFWESNSEVALTMRRLSSRLSPGFVVVFGNRPLHHDQYGLRVYLNTTPSGAVDCMRLLVATLDDADVPFAFKALDDSSRFSRADACVLYAAWEQRHVVGEIVIHVAARLGEAVKSPVPALTLPIAPGVGIAQGSGDDSFGRARSTALADALVSAWESGAVEVDACAAFVRNFCMSRDFDLDHPYLQPALEKVADA